MIVSMVVGLPAWVLDVLDALMILGALGGLAYLGERLIDRLWPAGHKPPDHLMRTADAQRIEDEVGELWGREATRVERIRAGQLVRPSYPKQPEVTDRGDQPAPRAYPHLAQQTPRKP